MQFTKLADGHVTAPQPAIDGLVEALRAKTGARFIPAVGKTPGFKLYAIRVGSYLDAIGLLNGDTLTAIDGQPIDTVEHLEQVLHGLHRKPDLRLDVLRAGAPVAIVITANRSR
jgi:S1-C subfamily serine protease